MEEAIPTSIYTVSHDEVLPQEWDPERVSEPGHRPAYLYVEKGPGQGQLLPVRQGALVIGRASVSELRLQHPSVSRRHAQLTRLGERFYLKDLGSQNGTVVNKIRIETEIEVYPGDHIAIGTAQLKLRGATDRIAPEMQQQIRSVQTAKRKAVAAAPPQKPARSNVVAVAAACTAIGFGLAALGFAFITFKHDAVAPAEEAAAPVAVEATSPVVEAAPSNAPVAQKADKPQRSPAAAVARPAPEKGPHAEPKRVARAEPSAQPAPEQSEEEEEEVEEAASAGPDRAAIIAKYEEGNVEAAIALAKAAGDSFLVQRLTDFQTAYAQAENAEKANDASTAIRSYERAYALDKTLSEGWGKLGPILSSRLGDLYTRVGDFYRGRGETTHAVAAFKEALKYAPGNATAKTQLASLEAGAAVEAEAEAEEAEVEAAPAPAPRPVKRKAAIADAWDDAAADSKSTGDKRVNAIEDAWND